jgi:hypothetical protein
MFYIWRRISFSGGLLKKDYATWSLLVSLLVLMFFSFPIKLLSGDILKFLDVKFLVLLNIALVLLYITLSKQNKIVENT